MRTITLFLCFLIFFSFGLQQEGATEPVICDPMQAIDVSMEVIINDSIMADLQETGIQEFSLTPAENFSWTETFPAINGAQIKLTDTADPLSIAMQEGLLVTYNSCEGSIVYAYCQLTDDLKGAFPKDVKLHLNPALKQCKIEVLCTQCP